MRYFKLFLKLVIRWTPYLFFSLLVAFFLFEVACRTFALELIKKSVPRYQTKNIQNILQNAKKEDPRSEFNTNPHPYLGYTKYKYGYIDTVDVTKDVSNNEEFNIGIFGGSVAEGHFTYNYLYSFLQESLSLKTGLSNNFRLINFSAGGYKQPQQFIMAGLIDNKIDLAINIEGVNEITVSRSGEFPFFYPPENISKIFFSPLYKAKLYNEAVPLLIKREQLIKNLAQNYLLRSVEAVHYIRYLWNQKKLFRIESDLTKPLFNKNKVNFVEGQQLKYWFKMSCLQQTVLANKGVKSLYFIQPVAYLPDSKSLSKNEKKMIEQTTRTHGKDLDDHVALFRTAIDFSQSFYGLNLIDLTQIFKNEKRTVYIDGCCHLNKLGHSILAKAISEEIEKQLSEEPRPNPCPESFLKKIRSL